MAEPGPRRASGPLVRVLGRRDLRVLWTSGTLSEGTTEQPTSNPTTLGGYPMVDRTIPGG